MVQNRKRMVNALAIADSELINHAAWVDGPPVRVSPANKAKKRCNNMKTGAPGEWPTSSLYAQDRNSPQSQKLTVGSIVIR